MRRLEKFIESVEIDSRLNNLERYVAIVERIDEINKSDYTLALDKEHSELQLELQTIEREMNKYAKKGGRI